MQQGLAQGSEQDLKQDLKQGPTIVAIATAPGMGGVGIVRLSGASALAIGAKLFPKTLDPRVMTLGPFLDTQGEVLDEGLAVAFPAPNSFTGEDVVEFHGHGGPVVLRLVVEACMACGATLAAPGEFTQRAFLNDKLDLAQAEAIADLIASSSAMAARSALRSLQGAFSSQVFQLGDELRHLRLFVEATLDFPDEEEVDRGAEFGLTERLDGIAERLSSLLQNTRSAATFTEGVTVALVGAPNAGKSSLLNALSGEDRAIVTDIPGTTRDLLPVDLDLDGLPVRLVDTAGIRLTEDIVEQQGVERAKAQAEQADVVLVLVDASSRDWQQELSQSTQGDALELTERLIGSVLQDSAHISVEPERSVLVLTKADLVLSLSATLGIDPDDPSRERQNQLLVTSATSQQGLQALKDRVKQQVGVALGAESNTFTARQRHVEALQATSASLERAQELAAVSVDGGVLLAEELRLAHDTLGQIVGVTTPDDLLGDIFQNFCIGK